MVGVRSNVIVVLLVIGFLLWQMIPAPEPFNMITWQVLGCMVVMVVLWITEALPIPVTALLPLLLFPIVGVDSLKNVSASYAHPIVFLFLGGFFLALSLEKSRLHERIALHILKCTGSSLKGVVLGFLIATSALSMFISNTATTLMMLPIALSVLHVLEKEKDLGNSKKTFAIALMLSIAYAANIGGSATLIGTPPNMVLVGYLEQQYHYQLGFLEWMLMGIPFAFLMLGFTYYLLVFFLFPVKDGEYDDIRQTIIQKIAALGKMKPVEKRVLVLFIFVVLGWVFRRNINDISDAIHISDTWIAMLGGMLMFMIPNGEKSQKPILEWADTKKVAWGIILLFGGGLALAHQLQESGLVEMIGAYFDSFSGWHTIFLVLAVTATVLFLTEIMSNVALITLFLPVIAAFSASSGQHPLLFMAPAALAASCAFTMPISTPPNAIVFSSGHVHTYHMAKAGIILNIVGVLLITLLSHTLIEWALGFGIN